MPRVPTPSAVLVWTPSGTTSSKRRWFWALGAAALCALGSAGAFLWLRRPPAGVPDQAVASSASSAPDTPISPGREPPPTASSQSPGPVESAAASPTTSAAASPTDVETCVASLLPPHSLEPDANLEKLCTEVDPRRGATLLRTEIARRGLVHRETTDAMREWATLSWYEMAAFALARGACCPRERLPRLITPQSIGTCESLGPALEAMTRLPAGDADTQQLLARFQSTVACIERGQQLNKDLATPFSYRGQPGPVAEASFGAILDRRKR